MGEAEVEVGGAVGGVGVEALGRRHAGAGVKISCRLDASYLRHPFLKVPPPPIAAPARLALAGVMQLKKLLKLSCTAPTFA